MYLAALKETKTFEDVYTTTSTEFVPGVFDTFEEAKASAEAFMLSYAHPHKFFQDMYDDDIIILYVVEITLGVGSVPTFTYVPVPKAIENAHLASSVGDEAMNE